MMLKGTGIYYKFPFYKKVELYLKLNKKQDFKDDGETYVRKKKKKVRKTEKIWDSNAELQSNIICILILKQLVQIWTLVLQNVCYFLCRPTSYLI